MNELDALVDSARAAFAQATAPADLENAKAQYLGKSGRITELMKGMAALSVDEKKTRGAAINLAKQAIEAALTDRRQALADAELQAQLKAEALDVTLPGRGQGSGGLHPVSLTLERIEAIFGSMGFEVADGPEIESDWFNFTALNTPEDHPRVPCTTPSTSKAAASVRPTCCAPTPARCRSAMRCSTSSGTVPRWMPVCPCPRSA